MSRRTTAIQDFSKAGRWLQCPYTGRVRISSIAVLFLAACSLETAVVAPTSLDAATDAATDARLDSRLDVPDSTLPRDARPDVLSDSAPDTTPPMDAGPTCPIQPDDDTIALFAFEDVLTGMFMDTVSGRDGTVAGGEALAPAGPPGCGDAFGFRARPIVRGVIPDASPFDLAVGSIDFFMRYDGDLPRPNPDTRDATIGVISRDANGTAQPGHMTVRLAPTGELILSIQRPSGMGAVRCTNSAITPGTWHHVAMNFGAPSAEIYLDGVRGDRTDTIVANGGGGSSSWACGDDDPAGIDGNDNPFVIGASASSSSEGGADGLFQPFEDGAMDQLRISRVRRAF